MMRPLTEREGSMTQEEAKEFYFDYYGYGFHMSREEPGRYSAFRSLHLPGEVLKAWDKELLEDLFRKMRSDPDHAWIAHGHILGILKRGNCDVSAWASRLLDEMESMDRTDAKNRILITENMVGRNGDLSDGGAYLICRFTPFAGRMDQVMEHLMRTVDIYDGSLSEEKRGWEKPAERCRRAAENYRTAVRKWSTPTQSTTI